MLQLVQKLKNGEMKILDVPQPQLQSGQVLVKNHFSVISAGTEISTVKAARKGFIGKAKDRPQQVKQVIDTVKSQGVAQTYRVVMKKLDAYSPLGYSSSGEILQVAPDVKGFEIGDRVACGGLSACHSEIVAVPANLAVKLSPDADLKQAAYNTIGAIALQGVRQAELKLGETCAIIGLGLIGQITALLLRASGVRTIGIDIDPYMVEMARTHVADLAFDRETPGIDARIKEFTHGIGCDAVIITAASSSLDPINFAGSISRKKGAIVVVGAIPTGFDREPDYYKKELQVKMSCSYGPGRYDPMYEEHGIDYPAAYVRWTENRNMAAFQELIHAGKIDLTYLTTHTYKLPEAELAYELILKKPEPYIGILLEYEKQKSRLEKAKIYLSKDSYPKTTEISVGFLGAGSYAQSHLLPNIKSMPKVSLKGVLTASGTGSRSVAERFGFEFCADDEKEILQSPEINTVFITSRHDSHADYVVDALASGKHVFVEKPLCMSIEQLEQIFTILYSEKTQTQSNILMVGYNRRFSPLSLILKEAIGNGPMAMLYRINAGEIPKESWIHDNTFGGGRIVGEVCHFIDFFTFLNGSLPVRVHAIAMNTPENLEDVLTIALSYENGSIGSISYIANGGKGLPKEYVEVHTNGISGVLNDFKSVQIYTGGKKRVKKLASQNKGQQREIEQFVRAIKNNEKSIIPYTHIYSTSIVTFKIIESLRTGESVSLEAIAS